MKALLELFQMMDLIDLIDILLTSVIFYYAIKFIRERRAGKLAIGIVLLIFLEIAGSAFELPVISFLMQNLFQVGIIAMIILFQPELRSALEKIGGVRVDGIRGIITQGDAKQMEQLSQQVEAICTAACDLALDKTGALIVFERSTKLGEYIRSGTVLNADISPRMIKNIFFNKAPLHDGALIIREGRLYAAGCFLPLPTNNEIDRDFGTRHRAAIGMSENSDAIVVVVSEETGIISVAKGGELQRNYDYRKLYNELMTELSPNRSAAAQNKRKQQNDDPAENSDDAPKA
ncbi:MAG: diadenylate cyclase CdaA [Eubacteriales bacterium]